MYCVKCGHPADDGNEYCANCGAELQKPIVIPEEEEPNQDVVPSKDVAANRIKPILLIGAGAIVLVALVLLVLNFASVRNWLLRSTSSPEELLLTAYKSAISTSIEPLMDNYEKVLTAGKSANFKSSAEITLKPGKQILDMLTDAIYAGEGDMSWLSEIRIHADFAVQEKLQENVLTVGLGDQDILSVEMIADSLNQKMYLAIPELNDQALMTDMGQGSEIVYPDMTELYGILPSGQVLEQLAVRYMDILLGGFSSVEKYSETLTLDGISQDVTVLEAYIDHIDLLEVFVAALEQVKADEEIKQILEDFSPWYNDMMEQSMSSYNEYFGSSYETLDLYAELIAAVDASLAQLQDEFKTADPENHLYLYTYLDKHNRIIGTKLLISGMEETVSSLTLSEGGQYSTQILMGDLQIKGGGLVSDSLSGNFAVSIAEEKLLDMKAENVTQSKGTVYLEPSAVLLEMFASEMGMDAALVSMADVVLCVSFEESDSSSQCAVSVISNEVPLLDLNISGKTVDVTDIQLPENAAASDDEEAAYNWLAGCDLEALVTNLSNAGVPEELLTALLSGVAAQ